MLLLAPGLALTGLLPAAVRRHPLAELAAAPVLGFTAVGVALITASRLGLAIDAWSSHGLVLALCAAGLLLPGAGAVDRERPSAWEALGLAAAVALGAVLAARMVGDLPLPGNDWAKYALYADEIRRQGSILIDNPFWMLGVPFREDPATPAVYGAALAMGGGSASAIVQGIWVLSLMGVLAVFALVRAWWGPAAACLAAGLYAAVPVNQDILGWHGLANVAAFALLALALAYTVALLRDGLGRREAVGFGLLLVGMAATHRLTATVGLAAVAAAAGAALVASGREGRVRILRQSATVAVAGLVLGGAVASDLIARQRTFGGTQPFDAYLDTKVDIDLALRDLTRPFIVVSAVAVLALLRATRRDRGLWPLQALLVVTVALAYAWLLHIPLAYLRMVYFLPLSLAPLTAIWLARGRRAGLAAGVALVSATSVFAWTQADRVHDFYAFTDRASRRGLDAVAARLRPGEVVVTDRCWSFLSTWLLHTRTLPALLPQDIGPAAEVPFARQAQAVLDGSPAGLRRARALGVRFLIVDPQCVDGRGRPLDPPLVGEPVYVSRRLAVLELPRNRG